MKIKSLEIRNFRSFSATKVDFEDYTAFVGANGAGKSTVLCALNIFFRQTDETPTNLTELEAEDFHNGNIGEPIEISVTFHDLSQEAQVDFAEYYRAGLLVISSRAEFNADSRSAPVLQFAKRSAMAEFSAFFRLYNDGAKAGDLSKVYDGIRAQFPDLPKAGSKDANRDALRAYEEQHPEKLVLLDSADQFYGFSKGANRLAKYVQWVYVPAVKDATTENVESRNSALGKLLSRTVRSKVKFDEKLRALREQTLESYKEIMKDQQTALDDISKALTTRLGQWAHPEAVARLKWTEDPRKSVQIEEPTARLFAGEGDFSGDLARFGHGLQRSYLLALLQELATTSDEDQPLLILGVEEPELYQHPPQAKHLASVFKTLTSGNAQVIVSTHSPYFVTGRHFENVRLVRRDDKDRNSSVKWSSCGDIAAALSDASGEKILPVDAERAHLHQALQPHINEMFFTRRLILVEGLEDIAYITAWLAHTDRWDDFRRSGCHLVAVNGKSFLFEPIVVSQQLGIPTFVIFDADGNTANPDHRKKHARDNGIILKLLGGDPAEPFPAAPVWHENFVVWPANLGTLLKAEVGAAVWEPAYSAATKGLGNPEGSFAKNTVHIGEHLALLKAKDAMIPTLDRVCSTIMGIAK
jgi:putative ATP-dependent endonuclease of OLD family